MASILSFSEGVRKGIGSTSSPHSPLDALGIVAGLREEQEGIHGREPGLPWVLEGKERIVCQDCCMAWGKCLGETWGCFSHVTLNVLLLLDLSNQE